MPQRNRNELGETIVNKTGSEGAATVRKINNLENVHCVRDTMTLKVGSEHCHFATARIRPEPLSVRLPPETAI
jgi:hypothetical protein